VARISRKKKILAVSKLLWNFSKGRTCAADKRALAPPGPSPAALTKAKIPPKTGWNNDPIRANGRFPTDSRQRQDFSRRLLKCLEISTGKCGREERKEQCL